MVIGVSTGVGIRSLMVLVSSTLTNNRKMYYDKLQRVGRSENYERQGKGKNETETLLYLWDTWSLVKDIPDFRSANLLLLQQSLCRANNRRASNAALPTSKRIKSTGDSMHIK